MISKRRVKANHLNVFEFGVYDFKEKLGANHLDGLSQGNKALRIKMYTIDMFGRYTRQTYHKGT
jgi:hypothetical protein